MPTIGEPLLRKSFDDIGAKHIQPTELFVRQVRCPTPPRRDAFPEDQPPVPCGVCGVFQRLQMGLLRQISDKAVRQMTAPDLGPALLIPVSESLAQ
jgi:hypothetical protein